MTRFLAMAALLTATPLMHAQLADTAQTARLEMPAAWSSSVDSLPDAPEPALPTAHVPVEVAPGTTPNYPSVAKKYAGVILPGQKAVPWNEQSKFIYALHDSFGPINLVAITASAGWSQLIDSAPHYGTNAEAFGKRVGAAAARNTVQSMATDALFAPIFHDDPRYYVMGPDQNFFKRAAYAASRVVVTRSDHGHNRINLPLLLGYGAAAGVNNLYYPDRDTGAKGSMQSWGTSLGGAAVGMIGNEFLDDALRLIHLRK